MKVIIALDDSPYAKHVLDLVCRRHWPLDVEFKILHVIEPLCADAGLALDYPDIARGIEEQRARFAEKLCADARHRLEKHFPEARVHFELREGRAKNEIVLAAADWEANRIIIGAHGKNVCPHNLMGSVSRSVAERSPCSVEIIRSGSHAQTEKNTASKKEAELKAGR